MLAKFLISKKDKRISVVKKETGQMFAGTLFKARWRRNGAEDAVGFGVPNRSVLVEMRLADGTFRVFTGEEIQIYGYDLQEAELGDV
jgi:hypothetical protein